MASVTPFSANAPAPQLGFLGRLIRWLRDVHNANAMYRIAPTRKL